MPNDPKPWERQPGEPDDAFRHFTTYRDMPLPRKLDRRIPNVHITKLVDFYRDWNWKVRCSAYDDYLSAFAVQEYEDILAHGAKEAAVQHMGLLNDAKELAAIELRKWLVTARAAGDGSTSLLRMGDLTKLIEGAIKLDRLVRGEATEIVEQNELTNLTDDELRELERKERGE